MIRLSSDCGDRNRLLPTQPAMGCTGLLRCVLTIVLVCLAFLLNGTAAHAGLVIGPANELKYEPTGRHALVIGNSDYDQVASLTNPKADATDIAEALKRLGFEVTLVINADQENWSAVMKKFSSRARGAETALIYYAGHGLQLDGKNFLLPVDAEIQSAADLPFQSFDLDFILRSMPSDIQTGIVFLDACRNNPLAGAFGDNTRGLGIVPKETAMRDASHSRTRGLGRVEPKPGLMVSFATAPGMVAYDGDGRNSPFTRALLDHIETPGIEVSEMLRRVRKDVADATQGNQIPWVTSSISQAFFFNPQPAPATHAAVPTAAAVWNEMAGDRSTVALANFIASFPESPLAEVARSRLELAQRDQAQHVATSDLIPMEIEVLDTIVTTQPGIEAIVFDSPDPAAEIIARLGAGTNLEVTGRVRRQHGWYRVRLSGGASGYIEQQRVQPVENRQNEPQSDFGAVAESDSFIRIDTLLRARRTAIVRSVPSQDSSRLFYVPTRQEVEVIGISKNKKWCMVRDEGSRTGYVMTSMLEDLDGSSPAFRNLTAVAEPTAKTTPKAPQYELIEGLMIANADVAIRQKPDPTAEQIRELRKGDQIYARARSVNSEWVVVQLEENTSGYVYLKRLDKVDDDSFFKGIAEALFANVWYAIGALLLAMLGFGLEKFRRRFSTNAAE